MTDDNRAKILDKLAKLLRMADDVSSPNEAAIAARMAKKLMDEYNVTHADALGAGMTLNDFIERNVGDAKRAFPKHLASLAIHVARYSDCYVKFAWSERGGKVLKFQGEATDLAIAEHLYVYLVRSLNSLWRNTCLRGRAAEISFKTGAVGEIGATLARMKSEEREWFKTEANSKALVVVNQKAAMLAQKFGTARYRASRVGVSDGGAYQSGQAAGRNVGVRRAINTSSGVRSITRQ